MVVDQVVDLLDQVILHHLHPLKEMMEDQHKVVAVVVPVVLVLMVQTVPVVLVLQSQ